MSSANPVPALHRKRATTTSKMRKSERTRQAILDAALNFLWTHPFRDLTVGELMASAGASRSAFYQYFADLHDLMETLLRGMQDDIFGVAEPWLQGEGDPVALLRESLDGLVEVCYQRGPILRAVSDAAAMDERLENAWSNFLKAFDDAVTDRIKQHQELGLVAAFKARPVAVALNRMNAAVLIQQFGRRPRGKTNDAYQSISRIWISTLYGYEALSGLEDS